MLDGDVAAEPQEGTAGRVGHGSREQDLAGSVPTTVQRPGAVSGRARTTPAAQAARLQRSLGNRAAGRLLGRLVTSTKLETETPLRATETGPMPQTMIVNGKFAVYVPWGWIAANNLKQPADITDVKVHVFFGAGGVTGDEFNDVLLHGLRSASNPTEWITIAVAGTTTRSGASIPTPFSDSDITDCLSAIGIAKPVTSLRLSGHSRGMVSLVAYAPRCGLKSVIDRVHVLDEFQVGNPEEGTYVGKVEVLRAAGIPAAKIIGYESQDPAKIHLRGVKYVTLDPFAMAVIGTVRLIQDGIARDPAIASAAAATRTKANPAAAGTFLTVKDEAASLVLPERGSLPSTAAPGTASLQSWSADPVNRRAMSKISLGKLLAFVNSQNLTRYTGQDWAPFAAHEFFVNEIAPELYN
jgi:hypothetical protein